MSCEGFYTENPFCVGS